MGFGVDWFVWRIVLADRINDGLHGVKRYTIGELAASHAALDAVARIRKLEEARAKRKKPPTG